MNLIFSFIVIIFASQSNAETQVAFIEMRNQNGELQQMEPGGRFSHVAISYNGQWLHSHPYRGVEIIGTEDLEKMGSATTYVPAPDFPDITRDQIKGLIGKPSGGLNWENPEGYYCSKLVGKLLEMTPMPMGFDSKLWREKMEVKARLWGDLIKNHKGQLGLSPDDIYAQLNNPEYLVRVRRRHPPLCRKIFE